MRTLFLLNMRTRLLFTILPAFIALNTAAQEQSQTLILAGSTLNACTSSNAKNCINSQQIKGKQHSGFKVTKAKIKQINLNWPTNNTNNKNAAVQSLAKMLNKSTKPLSKSDLLWQWRDINNEGLNSLSKQEYSFVVDMLEEFKADKVQVNTALNAQNSTNNILQFISGSLKVNNPNPSMLVITASSKDPYSTANRSTALFDSTNINTQWLALTPALAKAITTNSCNNLPALRQSEMGVYNRELIYPEQTKAEMALCKGGVHALTSLIKNSTGVMFNDGDVSLTRKVLFDQNNNPYPWTQALQSRPVIVGEGAGSLVQSAAAKSNLNTAIVTGGSSLGALRGDKATKQQQLTYTAAGGLGSFNYGLLDTQFSEQNRTLRLATLLNKTSTKAKSDEQLQQGFGIDENTALVVIKSPGSNLITVLGSGGVVHLTANTQGKTQGAKTLYNYSYWPAGSVIDIKNNKFSLSERTVSQALPSIKIPSLPVQRFGGILYDSKLRSLTQAMCLSQEQSTVAQQDEFLIGFSITENTSYHRVNAKEFGCAISNLNLALSTF
ncbi:cyanophycinase [Pseudoalteromonas agarivorans]|uniref:cyanophycinase n=1 Tax=Pseudoalteromonas agarivorans TaxID=176102 RepID=UPI00311DB2D5